MESVEQESVLWNPGISGLDAFMMTSRSGYPETETSCLVDDVYDQSSIDWLFGFSPSCRLNASMCSQPSVAGMLHTAANYTWHSCQTVRGVHTNLFTGTWSVPRWGAELSVRYRWSYLYRGRYPRYYWSDPVRWQSSSGKSVPVRCELEGSALDPETGLTVPIVDTIDYQDFFDVSLGPEAFQPVRDMVCVGRRTTVSLPTIPDAVEYGSELVLFWRSPTTNILHKIVSPRDNWYDHGMLLARTDYRPIDVDSPSDPYNGRVGMQSDIQDFFAGVSYQINKDFGNCTVLPLWDDPDNLTIEDGRLQMADPLHLFHMDKQFAFNGPSTDRSVKMDYYVATTPVTTG